MIIPIAVSEASIVRLDLCVILSVYAFDYVEKIHIHISELHMNLFVSLSLVNWCIGSKCWSGCDCLFQQNNIVHKEILDQ